MATILVLDDEKNICSLMTRILDMKGYDVLAFDDVQLALATVDFERVDLIVTDYNMPIKGNEVIAEIQDRGYDIPFIVLSGFLDDSIICIFEALGVAKILTKPILLSDLVDAVEETLSDPFQAVKNRMPAYETSH